MSKRETFQKVTLRDFGLTAHKDVGDSPQVVYDPKNVILQNGVIRPAISLDSEVINVALGNDVESGISKQGKSVGKIEFIAELKTDSDTYYIYREAMGSTIQYVTPNNQTPTGIRLYVSDDENDATYNYSNLVGSVNDIVEYQQRLYLITETGLFVIDERLDNVGGTDTLILYKHDLIDPDTLTITTTIQTSGVPSDGDMGSIISGGVGGFGVVYAFAYKLVDGTITPFFKYIVVDEVPTPGYVDVEVTKNKLPPHATHLLCFRYDFQKYSKNDITQNLDELDYKMVFVVDTGLSLTLNNLKNCEHQYMDLASYTGMRELMGKSGYPGINYVIDKMYVNRDLDSKFAILDPNDLLGTPKMKLTGSFAQGLYNNFDLMGSRMRMYSVSNDSDNPNTVYFYADSSFMLGVFPSFTNSLTILPFNRNVVAGQTDTTPAAGQMMSKPSSITIHGNPPTSGDFIPGVMQINAGGSTYENLRSVLDYCQAHNLVFLFCVDIGGSTYTIPAIVESVANNIYDLRIVDVAGKVFSDDHPVWGQPTYTYLDNNNEQDTINLTVDSGLGHIVTGVSSVTVGVVPLLTHYWNGSNTSQRLNSRYLISEDQSSYAASPNFPLDGEMTVTISNTPDPITLNLFLNGVYFNNSTAWVIPHDSTYNLISAYPYSGVLEFTGDNTVGGNSGTFQVTEQTLQSDFTKSDYGYYSPVDITPSARYIVEGGQSITLLGGRLFIGGIKYEGEWHYDVVAYSLPGEPGAFVDVMSVAHGTPAKILKVDNYRNYLLVVKEDSVVFVLVDQGADSWQVANTIKDLQIPDQYSVTVLGSHILLWSGNELYHYYEEGMERLTSRFTFDDFMMFIPYRKAGMIFVGCVDAVYGLALDRVSNVFELIDGSFNPYLINIQTVISGFGEHLLLPTTAAIKAYDTTIVPSSASLEFTLRLLPGDDVKRRVKNLFFNGNYGTVEVDNSGVPASEHEVRYQKRIKNYIPLNVDVKLTNCQYLTSISAYIRNVNLKQEDS